MRPISSTTTDPTSAPPVSRAKGPAVRGQARAAEVHALKAQGLSPSRKGWRDAAATPAVVVTLSAEATAALAALPPATEAPTPPAVLPTPVLSSDPTVAPEPSYLDIMVG